jgi:hypothetical protein
MAPNKFWPFAGDVSEIVGGVLFLVKVAEAAALVVI